MMTISADDRKDPPKDALHDPWADWKPQWRKPAGKKRKKPQPPTPYDFQEKHSPTETVTAQRTATRAQNSCQRRIVDARLWQAMSAHQQSAAIDIARAFETMGRGLGYVTSDWRRVPGAHGPSSAADMHARLIGDYVDWTKRCHAENVSHSMVIDILVFGFSCRALDTDRRVRTGSARDNLLAGLSLYCRLRGWPDR